MIEDKAKIYLENLINSLPDWQRIFAYTPAFEDCFRIMQELSNSKLEQEEIALKRQELMHAKMVFDNICETDPEGIKNKKIVNDKREQAEKEKRLNALYEKHKKGILDQKQF